jgi:hypothetical protein
MNRLTHLKRFNESNEDFDFGEVKFVDAESQGIVEHGYILLHVGDSDINITIQQYSNGVVIYLLDDLEYKDILESNGVEFDGDEEIVGPSEFISDLFNFYVSVTTKKR